MVVFNYFSACDFGLEPAIADPTRTRIRSRSVPYLPFCGARSFAEIDFLWLPSAALRIFSMCAMWAFFCLTSATAQRIGRLLVSCGWYVYQMMEARSFQRAVYACSADKYHQVASGSPHVQLIPTNRWEKGGAEVYDRITYMISGQFCFCHSQSVILETTYKVTTETKGVWPQHQPYPSPWLRWPAVLPLIWLSKCLHDVCYGKCLYRSER